MNVLFNLIPNDRFKTSDGRTFKVINLVWQCGLISDIDFMQIHEEPEPTELIRKPYNLIQELVINKKIILI